MFLKLWRLRDSLCQVTPKTLDWHGMNALEWAHKYIVQARYLSERSHAQHGRLKHAGFYGSKIGVYCVYAAVHLEKGDENSADNAILCVLEAYDVMDRDAVGCDVLYGLSGYLYALRFLSSEISALQPSASWSQINARLAGLFPRVIDEIVNQSEPLYWTWGGSQEAWAWHKSHYVGAIHGLSGILTQIISCPTDALSPKHYDFVMDRFVFLRSLLVRQGGERPFGCINYGLIAFLTDVFNFPSSLEKVYRANHTLFQFCHGAPGVVHCFYALDRLVSDEKSMSGLESDIQACLASTFKRGWLTKGVGICHGLAGTLYAFLGGLPRDSKAAPLTLRTKLLQESLWQ